MESAAKVMNIVQRQPKITNPQNGVKLDKITGDITLEKVEFTYPNRKGV